jgi:hypothetical protein
LASVSLAASGIDQVMGIVRRIEREPISSG